MLMNSKTHTISEVQNKGHKLWNNLLFAIYYVKLRHAVIPVDENQRAGMGTCNKDAT